MIAPIPSAIRFIGPSVRLSDFSESSASFTSRSSGLRIHRSAMAQVPLHSGCEVASVAPQAAAEDRRAASSSEIAV